MDGYKLAVTKLGRNLQGEGYPEVQGLFAGAPLRIADLSPEKSSGLGPVQPAPPIYPPPPLLGPLPFCPFSLSGGNGFQG